MTPFDGDRLDPALTHGDVLLLISAHNMDTASHALRELLRLTRDELALRWWIDGFQGAAPRDRSSAARAATCSASATAPATRTPATTR